MWALQLITPPEVEPLTTESSKSQSRVDFADEDDLITGFCLGARMATEEHISRSLITQTWELSCPRFPWSDRILLPRGPVQAVNSVKYTDSTQTAFTLVAGTDYLVDLSQDLAEVVVPFGRTWPTAVLSTARPVVINFTAGYGDTGDSVPAPILIAMRQLVASWYENRESYQASRGIAVVEFPSSYEALLMTYRLRYSGPFAY